MSEQPYMKLWVADFLGDTLHLSAREIGQYMLLLMAMWRSGGYLVADEKKLARVGRGAVSADVMALFSKTDDGKIFQKRLLQERKLLSDFALKQSENAKARWRKTKQKPNATAHAKRMPKASLHSHSHLATSVAKEDSGLTPLAILQTVLSEDQAHAVIEHRRSLRSPLSKRSAELLAKEFAKCHNPNVAADEMIANGWRGFKLEWLENAARRNGPAQTARQRASAEQREGGLRILDEEIAKEKRK